MNNCENICGICGDIISLDSQDLNLKNIKLKCGHNFHYICINYSYKYSKNTRCPYCRQEGGKIEEPKLLCSAILKSGKNKGQRCNCKVLNNIGIFCGRHNKQNISN